MKTMAFYPDEFAITAIRKFCGAPMASPCNSRPFAVEVLLDHGRYAQIRRRQTFEEMTAGEHSQRRTGEST